MVLLAVGALASVGIGASFTSQTSNPANAWASGSVTLGDDDAGAVMFGATGISPGATGSRCLTVSYTGTLPTTVKLYVPSSSDPLSVAQYLDLTIQEGTGGGFGSCASFTPSSTLYSGTLATLATTHTDYTNGVGAWAPASPASRTFRITYTLNAATPANTQGATASATFQWESQA